jgi:precorrin-6B methylase 2
MLLVLFSEFLGIAILLVVIYFLGRPIIRGAIYFPTTPRGVKEMLSLAEVHAGQNIVDLGSGDGRILIACAERGAKAIGYEINPVLVWRSRRAVARAGVADRAVVYWKSFWDIDLSQFDAIIVYGIPYIMNDLQKKLERELRPGTKIVSNAFKFPGWQIVNTERKMHLYIWKG